MEARSIVLLSRMLVFSVRKPYFENSSMKQETMIHTTEFAKVDTTLRAAIYANHFLISFWQQSTNTTATILVGSWPGQSYMLALLLVLESCTRLRSILHQTGLETLSSCWLSNSLETYIHIDNVHQLLNYCIILLVCLIWKLKPCVLQV